MKETARWHSPHLERDVTMVRWGTYGTPVLIFPTAGGDAEEIERFHLVGVLSELLEAGLVKVYSVDSLAGAMELVCYFFTALGAFVSFLLTARA